MLKRLDTLRNFALGATDGGEIGRIKDFYFDDQTWKLRYFVVETGSWLFGRKMLIHPSVILDADWEAGVFPVNLTRVQIEQSPSIDTDKPVSRQEEEELSKHYGWASSGFVGGMSFLTSGMIGGVVPPNVPFDEQILNETGDRHYDKHLRSYRQVKDYVLVSDHDEIGEVEDFIVDSSDWAIKSLIVLAGTWYQGEYLSIPVEETGKIDYDSKTIFYRQTVEQLKNRAEYLFLDKDDF